MKINFITGEDWQGLYVDGVLIEEGHSIRVTDLLDILEEYKLLQYTYDEINQDYMEELGNLPDNFDEINKNELK